MACHYVLHRCPELSTYGRETDIAYVSPMLWHKDTREAGGDDKVTLPYCGAKMMFTVQLALSGSQTVIPQAFAKHPTKEN